MSVYVDRLKPSVKNKNWKYDKSCHMVADTLEELHEFAKGIKLLTSWFQNRLGMPHYDLTEGKRAEAIKAGAIEISDDQVVDRMREARKENQNEDYPSLLDQMKLSKGVADASGGVS